MPKTKKSKPANTNGTYFVSGHADEWRIRHRGEHFGPFTDLGEALRIAIDAARAALANGYDVVVRFREPGHPWRTIWARRAPSANSRPRKKKTKRISA